MNHKSRTSQGLPAALILVAAALASGPAMAQGLNIAVIDFDAAMEGCPLAEQRTAEQEVRQKGYQAQITAQERKVEDLMADRDAFRRLSPEWLAKNEEWEAAVSLYRNRVRRLTDQTSKEVTQLYLELASTVDQALGDYARQRKFDLVLRRWPLERIESPDDIGLLMNAFRSRDLLFNSPHLDRTQDFIDFMRSWKPAAEPAPAKTEVDKTSPPGKVSK